MINGRGQEVIKDLNFLLGGIDHSKNINNKYQDAEQLLAGIVGVPWRLVYFTYLSKRGNFSVRIVQSGQAVEAVLKFAILKRKDNNVVNDSYKQAARSEVEKFSYGTSLTYIEWRDGRWIPTWGVSTLDESDSPNAVSLLRELVGGQLEEQVATAPAKHAALRGGKGKNGRGQPESPADDNLARKLLKWVEIHDLKSVLDALREAPSDTLNHFGVAVGVARLRNFVEQARENLNNSTEEFWQDLFERNSWVLGQVYSYPVVIIRGQAYMGGKNIESRGGNLADFLYKNSLTENALIIEIKTPVDRLTSNSFYRNNAVASSKELTGAVQQTLQDLYTLRRNYSALVDEEDPEFRLFSPCCLVVIGNTANEYSQHQKRSFELFRNNQREVDIVTFDELIDKAENLLRLFEMRA